MKRKFIYKYNITLISHLSSCGSILSVWMAQSPWNVDSVVWKPFSKEGKNAMVMKNSLPPSSPFPPLPPRKHTHFTFFGRLITKLLIWVTFLYSLSYWCNTEGHKSSLLYSILVSDFWYSLPVLLLRERIGLPLLASSFWRQKFGSLWVSVYREVE